MVRCKGGVVIKDVISSAKKILDLADGKAPQVGLVLGSGLDGIAASIENPASLSYAELPGFPETAVEGHHGRVTVGQRNGCRILCLEGRVHSYEGGDMRVPLRALKQVGCDSVVLTCAAGSLKKSLPTGSIMVVSDHVNWSGISPLAGPNDAAFGPRFVDMTEAYNSQLRSCLKQAASDTSIAWHEGIYLWVLGPNFETPAEIKMFQQLGIDAIGMSTVPECLIARHCGLRVAALAIITNQAAGLDQANLTHAGTLSAGQAVVPNLTRLLGRFFALLVAQQADCSLV